MAGSWPGIGRVGAREARLSKPMGLLDEVGWGFQQGSGPLRSSMKPSGVDGSSGFMGHLCGCASPSGVGSGPSPQGQSRAIRAIKAIKPTMLHDHY